MTRSRVQLAIGVVVSVAVHGAILAVLFLVPPPKREAVVRRRPPVRVKLAALPKAPEPPPVVEVKPPEPKPEPKKPEPKPELKPPEPKPDPKKLEPKKPKKLEPKKPKKPKPKKPKPKKPKPEVEKPKTPPETPPPAPAPQKPAKKFTYDMPSGPAGGVAVPSAPEGEGGSRFGATDGSLDGTLDGTFRPGGDRPAAPTPDDDDEVVSITAVSRPPRLVRLPTAAELRREYPEAARRAGQEADVRVKVRVGKNGKVSSVRIVTSAGPAFDAAAKRLARRLRFKPALRDGKEVSVWTPPFPIKFRLDE